MSKMNTTEMDIIIEKVYINLKDKLSSDFTIDLFREKVSKLGSFEINIYNKKYEKGCEFVIWENIYEDNEIVLWFRDENGDEVDYINEDLYLSVEDLYHSVPTFYHTTKIDLDIHVDEICEGFLKVLNKS